MTYFKTIILIMTTAILSGCSSQNFANDFFKPKPGFVYSYKNKRFSKCRLTTTTKSEEGPKLTFEFINVRNSVLNQENIFFSVNLTEDNPIWHQINVTIGDKIIFKTQDGQIIELELIKDSIVKNNITLKNKTYGKIAYLTRWQSNLLKNSDLIYFDLTLKSGSQKRFKDHLRGILPSKRMNTFWRYCTERTNDQSNEDAE